MINKVKVSKAGVLAFREAVNASLDFSSQFNRGVDCLSGLISYIDKCASSMYLHGVRKGMHVAVILPNIPQAVFIFYACSKLGAVCDLIHPLSSVRELKDFIKNTDPRIVFVYDEIPAGFTFLAGKVKKAVLVNGISCAPVPAAVGIGHGRGKNKKSALFTSEIPPLGRT